MKIKLVFPTLEYKDQIMKYKSDFMLLDENMHGTAGLRDAKTFEEWHAALLANLSEDTVGEGLVPATTLLAVDEKNQLLGMIDIRHRLNDYLMKFGGHIGYSVAKAQRRKGVATTMLSLALDQCRKLGLSKVLITCDQDNLGSAKTILHNGGVLENEVIEEHRVIERYWIDL